MTDEVRDELGEPGRRPDLATNDAVAGETIMPGRGDGNDGPTGGAPREVEPEFAENDLAHEEVDLPDDLEGEGAAHA